MEHLEEGYYAYNNRLVYYTGQAWHKPVKDTSKRYSGLIEATPLKMPKMKVVQAVPDPNKWMKELAQ